MSQSEEFEKARDKSNDHKPLVGWMILEDYCDDMSDWSGVIAYPDPTGANLAWESPVKMIEYSAYEKLQARLAEAEAEREHLNDVVKERESWAAMRLETCKKLERDLDEALAWADRLAEMLESARGWVSTHAMQTYSRVASKEVGEIDEAIESYQKWRMGK